MAVTFQGDRELATWANRRGGGTVEQIEHLGTFFDAVELDRNFGRFRREVVNQNGTRHAATELIPGTSVCKDGWNLMIQYLEFSHPYFGAFAIPAVT